MYSLKYISDNFNYNLFRHINFNKTTVFEDIEESTKNTKLFERLHYMYRFDNKYFITVSLDEERNDLLVYKNQNNDVIEYCGFRTKITFEKIIGWNHYPIRGYNDKFLFTLKDKRVIILCHNNLYALQLSLE